MMKKGSGNREQGTFLGKVARGFLAACVAAVTVLCAGSAAAEAVKYLEWDAGQNKMVEKSTETYTECKGSKTFYPGSEFLVVKESQSITVFP